MKNLFFAPVCVFCQIPVQEQHSLCSSCWHSLHFINRDFCQFCQNPLTDYDKQIWGACCHACAHFSPNPKRLKIRSSLIYDKALKPWILAFKYQRAIELAPLFAKFFDVADFKNIDLIIPVPLHPWRLLKRTYNQAALLAIALKNLYGTAFPELGLHFLRKTRHTKNQRGKDADARLANIQNSFCVPGKYTSYISGKRVVILDDVAASGATLLECQSVLKNAGAADVRCVALASSETHEIL